MLVVGSKTRLGLTLALALLIEGKLLHCAWEDGAALRQSVAALQESAGRATWPAEPVSAPCENESSCLCRGATLAKAVGGPDFAVVQLVLLAAAETALPCPAVLAFDSRGIVENSHPPPLSGRQLRALIASLLI